MVPFKVCPFFIPEVFVQPQAAAPELSLSLHAKFNDKTKHSLSDLVVKRCGINNGLFVSSAMPQGNMDVSYDETYPVQLAIGYFEKVKSP